MRKIMGLTTACAAILISSGLEIHAQGAKPLVIVPNSSFVSKNVQVQVYAGNINLTAEQAAMPLSLKITNGSYSGMKFAWVRGFIDAGRPAPANPRPQGRMIVTERQFTKGNSVTIDVTGQLRAGSNSLIFQGAGMPGAAVSYELIAAPAAPGAKPGAALQISSVDPPEVAPGGTITLKGQGFDETTGNNKVTIYNRPAKIERGSTTELVVVVPSGLAPHAYSVDVTNSSGKSNVMQFDVSGQPEVSGCSLTGLVPGSTVDVYGNNFSKVAGKNVVTITVPEPAVKKNASVSSAAKNQLTVTIPNFPELEQRLNGGVATPAQLTVSVNGVQAPGSVQVFISIRPMSN